MSAAPIVDANSPLTMVRPRSVAQRGSALLFSLMALVVLMVGAVALVRSVSTDSTILGNLGFKQDATASADRATRQAVKWINDNWDSLSNDNEAVGYYSTNLDGLDVTGYQISPTDANYTARSLVNWDGDNCAYATTWTTCKKASDAIAIEGSTARYIITRLCLNAGDPNAGGNTCPRPLSSSGATTSTKGQENYAANLQLDAKASPYFRIVVRVVGGRNAVSYTETIVHR